MSWDRSLNGPRSNMRSVQFSMLFFVAIAPSCTATPSPTTQDALAGSDVGSSDIEADQSTQAVDAGAPDTSTAADALEDTASRQAETSGADGIGSPSDDAVTSSPDSLERAVPDTSGPGTSDTGASDTSASVSDTTTDGAPADVTLDADADAAADATLDAGADADTTLDADTGADTATDTAGGPGSTPIDATALDTKPGDATVGDSIGADATDSGGAPHRLSHTPPGAPRWSSLSANRPRRAAARRRKLRRAKQICYRSAAGQENSKPSPKPQTPASSSNLPCGQRAARSLCR